ncbi:hypothetical protein VMCG_01207 [Cytospora schulzeri]|uniref:Uncharacterized protein n=1 Tax=Cytospora schulzeri TaxID=448051 RepID=A0A423X5Y7_9PEZI|nr:hypothetical protein VMCG_01207 [Valsa malicola]
MAAVRIRPGLLDVSQLPPRTGTNQRYQRPRRDSLDSLYSGAIEGCSRDHHPECYPELWQNVNKPTSNGHYQDRRVSSPARRRSPPPPPTTQTNSHSSSSKANEFPGGYKTWLRRSFSRKIPHKAGAEEGAAPKKPSRKGKESPLTMEDRMFFMGIRPRPGEEETEKEESHPTSRPPPVRTASYSAAAKGPVIGGFVTYPQISGFHNPARASGSPLVVANPDPGSRAERVRDEAVRDQRVSRTNHRRRSSRSESKARGSGGAQIWGRGREDHRFI